MEIKRRTPGLDLVKHGGGFVEDAELVDQAQKHLRELLADPYYAEAYQRLRASDDPVLRAIRLPTKKGQWAGSHQRTVGKRRTGRPENPHYKIWFKVLGTIEEIDRKRAEGRRLIDWCRRIVNDKYPEANGMRRESVAQELAQVLRNVRKKAKKVTPR